MRVTRYTLQIVLGMCFLLPGSLHAAIYWVGNSAACTGSNVWGNVPAALLAAQLSPEADEIRLTRTLDYENTIHSNITISDWNPNIRGALTLSGGYADCFSAQSGLTVIGEDPDTILIVSTSSQPSSVVRIKNIELTASGGSGLHASGGAEVTLDGVLIRNNKNGIVVGTGAYVDVLSNSLIGANGTLATPAGGGIHCSGTNSAVSMRGQLVFNKADKGGNLYLSTGCFVELFSGALIQGQGHNAAISAQHGAGAYVDNGGELFVSGGQSRVTFDALRAEQGGALYVNGTGKATIFNALFGGNRAKRGTVLYAQNGGNITPQVSIERSGNCAFGINCSHINSNYYEEALIYLSNSMLDISHTVVQDNEVQALVDGYSRMLIMLESNSHTRLDHVGFIGNIAQMVIYNASGKAELTHNTIADNWFSNGGPLFKSSVARNYGILDLQNTVIDADSSPNNVASGTTLGKCNLVDDPGDMPPGSYFIGTPLFVNIANGDARQLPSSPGVDMCQNDYYAWSPNLDIESQATPVNEYTNPQGNPGETGGIYDAGYDEVYSTIGNDEFTMTVMKNGSGSGTVVSAPSGIACGGDCSEVYFQATLVTLNAVPAAGSVFAGWTACPLPNGAQCQSSMTANRNITATFNVASEVIFKNGFE